jgi:hypothetical protein
MLVTQCPGVSPLGIGAAHATQAQQFLMNLPDGLSKAPGCWVLPQATHTPNSVSTKPRPSPRPMRARAGGTGQRPTLPQSDSSVAER